MNTRKLLVCLREMGGLVAVVGKEGRKAGMLLPVASLNTLLDHGIVLETSDSHVRPMPVPPASTLHSHSFLLPTYYLEATSDFLLPTHLSDFRRADHV